MDTVEDILQATSAGDSARLSQLLGRDATLASSYGNDGWTPLHLAAFYGHCQIVEALLEAGASLNARSRNFMDNLPLHTAVAGKRADLVRMLLARGAGVNSRQDGGWTPLHEAAQT